VVVVVTIAVVTVMIPIALLTPLVRAAIPPSVVLVPAAIPLCVQIAPALLGLFASFAVMTDRLVKSRLSFLDAMLAFLVIVIRPGLRRRTQKHDSRNGGNRRSSLSPIKATLKCIQCRPPHSET